MGEVKNSFLKSRMNQDLDDRLIPNGEYRYANNISVGKSEADDIGALENILGNELLALTTPTLEEEGLECIGAFMDNQNNRIFQFLTNYTDPSPNNITLPSEGTMKITMYDFNSPENYVTLAEGLFLNFAKNKEFRITGVNLIEGLLFWTDNRNQPRKINVASAANNPNYYTTEDQISVAKYAPVDSITLYKKVVATVTDVPSTTEIILDDANGIVPGMTIISEALNGGDYVVVTSVVGNTITLYESPPAVISIDDELTFLISTMTDKSSVPTWPGDPAFLEDKYVRFSYRFKYDDNEYSLMAPFTQIAYIPKQKGYFIAGNETDAYRSTIINWFENNINNIELIIPLPDKINNLTNSYKIKEIDILYKESDSLSIKVFETLQVSAINTVDNANNNYYIQPYQSQKPYKTLPNDQTTRVYDKVPVRAKAQESAGNRIIYGNYYDKYTCVSSINYNVAVQPKSLVGTNFIEYPNHTLKKNRNYQVGFVLADKFGRQSPVILSSVDLVGTSLGAGEYTKGSTVYSSYENSVLFSDVRRWFGDTLVLYLNTIIDQQKDIPSGKPGLYAIPTSNSGFAITASTITDTIYTYTLDPTAATNTPPAQGDILRGFYTDYVKVLTDPVATGNANEWYVETSGRVNDIYLQVEPIGEVKDLKFSYIYNPIGWYSYKIVVKQQEQDYYNVYLPGMLNGYPKNQTYGSQVTYDATGIASLENGVNITQFPVSETGNTAHIVLINDNINKVPRDLTEVGPDQKQYRSSVQLYGRVENTEATVSIIGVDPAYSAKVTTITYDTATVGQGDWTLIKPGDGIQCDQANIPDPLPSGGTQPNPYRWFKDTVVVSNEVDALGIGTITLSVPNWVIDTGNPSTTYKNFTITRAENKQYFPTRKADTVISIATASEFNFIDNSADNISGTAALNFYQLQNSPLIGRVSTVNKIGVVGEDMIPFLSVYETRPEESILELFWETATTGLISDLNADVLNGFDGPSSFGDVNYIHYENQDPTGIDPTTGGIDSKYITDEFTVLNQNGIILLNTEVTLTSVIDGDGNSRIGDFALENTTSSTYRLYIKSPIEGAGDFVFNNNAAELESYVFTFNVVDLDDPSTATELTINGRLRNNNPIITTSVVDYNITQSATTFVTLEANNGSNVLAETGLKWSIINGDTTPSSFDIDLYTGELSLINDEIPLGVYELEIKVQDAVNTSTGEILNPEGDDYGTKYDTITLNINVGDEPVPYLLRPLYTSNGAIEGGTTCSPRSDLYGMIYIGKKVDLSGTYLPEIPGSNREYQIVDNVEVVNGASIGESEVLPTGLTEGEYRIKVTLDVPVPSLCDPELGAATIRSYFQIYLYRRVWNNEGTGAWELTKTKNNEETEYKLPQLVVGDNGQAKRLTTSFTIEKDSAIFYEYAIGIEMVNDLFNTAGTPPTIVLTGEDANYSYDQITPNFTIPITNDYAYYTGVEYITGDTSGVPYLDQDAIPGLNYTSTTNTIASGSLDAGNYTTTFTLSTVNNQVSPGLTATITKGLTLVIGEVVGVNIANPAVITVQFVSPIASTVDLAGGNLRLDTVSPNSSLGVLYANTEEGTEVRRFYTDAGLTQKWVPPFADRFYIFQTSKNYDPDTTGKYSAYPYYCAKFNSDGEVIDQIAPAPNSQTAWIGQNEENTLPLPIANYSYNIYYEELIAP